MGDWGLGFDCVPYNRLGSNLIRRKTNKPTQPYRVFVDLGCTVGLANLLFCTNSLGLGVHVPRRVVENNYINSYTKMRFVVILS